MTQQPIGASGGGEANPATQRSRPLVLPEVFSGEGDFDDWISHFESVSAVNGWTDNENLLWICVRLTGKAHVAYTRLPHVTQQTYATVKGALRERFEPDSKCELYKVQFESRRKQREESWADFSDDLMVLVSKAFPNLQEEAREQLAMSDPQVSFGVKQRRPRKLSEAVAATIELESYLQGQTKYLRSANQKSHP